MPGIIITPGTFNPPAVPVQLVVGVPFPKTPVQTIRKWQQFSPRHVEETGMPAIRYPVIYSSYDFVSGDVVVGVEADPFVATLPNITPAGVRYVPEALYAKTGQDVPNKRYQALDATPPFAGGGVINLGLIEAQYGGDFEMPSNGIRVRLGFDISLAGIDGGGLSYSLSTPDEDTPGVETGTTVIGIAYPVNPASNGYINQTIDTERGVVVTLFYLGEPVDKITLGVRILAEITFTQIPGSPGGSLPIPEVDTGLTWSDTLYGLEAVSPGGAVPTIPYSGYIRESYVVEGELTLS